MSLRVYWGRGHLRPKEGESELALGGERPGKVSMSGG